MSDVQTAEPKMSGAATRRRWRSWVLLLAGLGVGLAALIAAGWQVDQRSTNWLYGVTPQPGLIWIWITAAAVFAMLSRMAWLLSTTPADARKLPTWAGVAIILTVAVIARLLMLIYWVPTLSDDAFRYRHDGHLVMEHTVPYHYLPSDINTGHGDWFHLNYVRKSPHQYDLLDRMSNNAFMPTVYLPVSEIVFGLGAWLEYHTAGDWYYRPNDYPKQAGTPEADAELYELASNPRMMPYRVLHTLFDLGVVAALMAACVAMGRSVWWSALYAWHPLALIETAGNGHLEAVGVFFFVLGVWALVRRRATFSGVWFALSLMVKPMGALGAGLIGVQELPRGGAWQKSCRPLLWPAVAFGVTLVLGFLPFITGVGSLGRSMHEFSNNWNFNNAVFELLRWGVLRGNTTPLPPLMNGLNLMSQALVLLLAWRGRWAPAVSAGHSTLLFLVFSPWVYPWYVLVALAMAALAFNPAIWAFSFTSLLSYGVWTWFRSTGQWGLPAWLLMLEWLPVLVLEARQLWRDARVPASGSAAVENAPLPRPSPAL